MPLKKLEKAQEKTQESFLAEEKEEYNEYIVNLFNNPKNWGELAEEDISVWHAYEGPCGDTMQFFLKIRNNTIEKIHFVTSGCAASIAAGSQTTILVEGKPLEFVETLKPEDIDNALGGLPDDHKHCAELALRTLVRSIEKYHYLQNRTISSEEY